MNIFKTILKSHIIDQSINILIDGLISNFSKDTISTGCVIDRIPIGTHIGYMVIKKNNTRVIYVDCYVVDDIDGKITLVSNISNNEFTAYVNYSDIINYQIYRR